MNKQNNQILSIQYLRGIAAALVTLYHMRSHLGASYSQSLVGRVATDIGAFGVDLFFIISGFIICLSTQRVEKRYLQNFIIRRIFRIYPLLIISILAYYALIYDGQNIPFLLRSLVPLHSNYEAIGPGFSWNMLIPAWTITYELFFYALFFIGMSISHKYRSSVSAILIIILFISTSYAFNGTISFSARHENNYLGLSLLKPLIAMSTSPMLINFVYGIALYYVFIFVKKPKSIFKLNILNSILIATIPIGIAFLFSNDFNGYGPTKWGIISLLILSSAVILEKFHGTKTFKSLIILGNISYALYLTHDITIRLIMDTKIIHTIDGGARALLVFSTSVLVAYICYEIIEKPCISFSRKIIRRQ